MDANALNITTISTVKVLLFEILDNCLAGILIQMETLIRLYFSILLNCLFGFCINIENVPKLPDDQLICWYRNLNSKFQKQLLDLCVLDQNNHNNSCRNFSNSK